MATIKLSILKSKPLIDGRYKIYIYLCHKRKVCYIPTSIVVPCNQFKNGQIVRNPEANVMNAKLRNIISEYQDRLDAIKHINMYDCKQLKDMLENGCKKEEIAATFQSVAQNYIKELIEDGRGNYAKLIERNSRYFQEYTRGEFLLAEITPQIISNYARFLKNTKKVSDTTVGMMMSRTRTIINRAKKELLVKYDVDPFAFYSIKEAPIREIDITIENIIKIKKYNPDRKRLVVARDLFMLSFYLGGMNLIDIIDVNFKNKDYIEYVRTKSRNTAQGDKRIIIPIVDEAKAIINKWVCKNGKLDFGYKYSYSNFNRYLSRSIEIMSEELNINQKVVFYSARKTFAQFSSDLGIPDAVIDYCLGHSDKSRGVIRYYTKVRQKQAEIAINRVVDYINNPEKYKDLLDLRLDSMLMKA